MVKTLSKNYLKAIGRTLKLQKFRKIEELRKTVKEADERAPGGIDKNFHKTLRLHGNTCKTYLDVVQKNTVRPFSKSSAKYA